MKKNSVFLVMLAVMLAFSMAFVGCSSDDEEKAKFVAVTNISGLPATATVGTGFTLSGTVEPANATKKEITWKQGSLTISAAQDNPPPNMVDTWNLTAVVKEGKADGTDYTQNFTITINPAAAAADWAVPTGSVTALTVGTWSNFSQSGGYSNFEKQWYSLSVTSGTTYYIFWEDAMSYAATDKTQDIVVSGYYSDGKMFCSAVDKAWTSPVSFKANEDGTVYLKAEPWGGAQTTATFSIVVSSTASKPAL